MPELLKEVYLFSNLDHGDWMIEEESNDGDESASIDGSDDESSKADDGDDQLSDVNSIKSVDHPSSDEESSYKSRKRNFSLLNLQGKSFKVAEGGQIVFEEGQLFVMLMSLEIH